MRLCSKLSRIGTLFVITLLLFACGSDRYIAAAKSAHVAASGIKLASDIKNTYADEGEISKTDNLQLTRVLKEVNGSILQCAEAAAKVEQFTPESKAALLTKCADIGGRVARLQQTGVIGTKSETARKRLRQSLLAVTVAGEGITSSIALVGSSANSDASRVAPAPPREGRALLEAAINKLKENESSFIQDIERLTATPN